MCSVFGFLSFTFSSLCCSFVCLFHTCVFCVCADLDCLLASMIGLSRIQGIVVSINTVLVLIWVDQFYFHLNMYLNEGFFIINNDGIYYHFSHCPLHCSVVPALSHEEANDTSGYRKYIIYFLTNHSLFYMCLHETVVELASIFDNYMCF